MPKVGVDYVDNLPTRSKPIGEAILKLSMLYVVGFIVLLSVDSLFAATGLQTLFGPQTQSNPLFGTGSKTYALPTLSVATTGTLTVQNGNGESLSLKTCTGKGVALLFCQLENAVKKVAFALLRPSNVEVYLNNVKVLAKPQWEPTVGSYVLPISLLKQNQLKVVVSGILVTSVKFEVKALVQSQNLPPVPVLSVNPASGFAPVTVSASGVGSTDPEANPLSYSWSFGDGGTALGILATHTYVAPGNYSVILTVTDSMGASANTTKSVEVKQLQAPTAILKITSASSGLVPFMASFDASASKDLQGQALTFNWDFGDGQTLLNAGPTVSHQFNQIGTFAVQVEAKNTSGAKSVAQTQVEVTQPTLPPDPAQIAPKLSQGNYQTPFFDSVKFLISGTNPIQKNLDVTILEERRASVLRGKILDSDGKPLSGITVRVNAHPEYGTTLTRADGEYDLIVNGGGILALLYEGSGYLTSSRQIRTGFQDYFFAPNVVLVKLDSKVTPVALGAPTAQVASGNVVSDSSGSRTPTVYFPSNTTGALILQDGTTRPISSLSFRATEYTVGTDGPKRMPADLPANVAYTHALELSADEAIAVGAKHIQFSKPVSYYIDNFLNMPIGYAVPLGVLNPDTRLWEGEHDGVVLRVLNVTNGSAVLDVKGQGQPATQAQLNALNISSEELLQLGATYAAGKSIWRVQLSHFSQVDLNFLGSALDDLVDSIGGAFNYGKPPVGECNDCGSIISVHDLSLKERIRSAALPFGIWYDSSKSASKPDTYTIEIQVTKETVTNDLLSAEYEIEIAGRRITGSVPTIPNQRVTYQWDGLDAYGRVVPNETIARVRVLHKLKRYYASYSEPGDKSWGIIGPNILVTLNEEREGTYIERNTILKIGNKISSPAGGINGWSPDILHSYDVKGNTLLRGDGQVVKLDESLNTLNSIGGNGLTSSPADGATVFGNSVGSVTDVAQAIDGSILYVDNSGAPAIRKITSEGKVFRVAGGNSFATAGDNGPALSASFTTINRMSVGPDGSIYVIESNGRIVRKISTEGVITKIAGTSGSSSLIQNNVLAVSASFQQLSGVLASKDGSVFLSDKLRNVIYKISNDGVIHLFAGTGTVGSSGDGGPALSAQISGPILGDIGPNEILYFVDYNNTNIRSIDPGGVISAAVGVAQSSAGNLTPDGALAATAKIRYPTDVKVARNGEIFFIEQGSTFRKVNRKGLLESVSMRGANNITEYGVVGIVTSPSMFIASDGAVIFGDTYNKRVRRIGRVLIGNDPNVIQIASQSGDEVFVFTKQGLHYRTLFGKTGKQKWGFSYDARGNLIQVVDADGGTLNIARSSTGLVQSITNKYGQVVTLASDSSGWLSSIQFPGQESYGMAYSSPGLLAQFTNPNGQTSKFEFNSRNNLVSDEDAAGAKKTLSRVIIPEGYESSIKYPDGTSRIARYRLISGAFLVSEVVERDGTVNAVRVDSSSYEKYTYYYRADNSYWSTSEIPDPRLGGSASYSSYTLFNFQDKNNREQTQVYLDRYDANNLFNFKTRQVTIDQDGYPQNTYVTDSLTKTNSALLSTGVAIVEKFDDQERTISSKVGTLIATEFTYNSFGKVAQVKQGDRVTSFLYGSTGLLSSMTDALGRKITYIQDESGRTTVINYPSGRKEEFRYDKNGNMTGVLPAGKELHELLFNIVDVFSIYKFPKVGAENNEYSIQSNSSKDVQKIVRADGKTTNYKYDTSRARVTSVVTGSITNSYGYDGYLGLRTSFYNSASGSNSGIQYAGTSPFTITENFPIQASLYFTRNAFGFPTRVQLNAGSGSSFADYSYDSKNRLTSVSDMIVTWRPADNLINSLKTGAVNETLDYNQYGELISMTSGSFGYSLVRDALGRITSKSENIAGSISNFVYSYDADNRLASVKKDGVAIGTYSYDQNGNRTSITTLNPVTAVFDAQDRLTQQGSTQYVYNAHGETIQKIEANGITNYDYGFTSQLTSVKLPNGDVVSYDYNGKGQRLSKRLNGAVTSYYFWETDTQLVAEINADKSLRARFIYGLQGHSPDLMIKDGATYRLLKDHLGSIRQVVHSGTGQVFQKMNYDVWGKVIEDTNPGFQPFGFAGGLYDLQTKLTKFGARDYDAETGRWTSKDPILFGGRQTNIYTYVSNDPLSWIDPTGLSQDQIDRAIDWLRKNHPEITTGLNNWSVMDGWLPFDGGITLPGNYIRINTCNMNDADVVDAVSHELQHARDGIWRTLIGQGRNHDSIYETSARISNQFRSGE